MYYLALSSNYKCYLSKILAVCYHALALHLLTIVLGFIAPAVYSDYSSYLIQAVVHLSFVIA